MNEGLLQVDDRDRVQFVNGAFCEIVGYTREELMGKVASEVLLTAEGAVLIQGKHALRRQGVADIYELQLRKKSGELIWVRISGAPVMDAGGNVVGSIGVHTDITLQKQADEELYRRYEMISAMQRLSSVLVQSMHLNRRLEAALDTVLDVMKFDGGTIFMFDEGGKELVLQHQRGFPDAVVERTRRWPVGKGVIGKVALTSSSAFIEDAREEPEIDPTIREMAGLSGIACVPLESKSKVLGVMTVFFHHPYRFSENEQLMLQTFGKQIGIALENAQLYETARERERQIRRLSIELVKVQEDERKRFARELHDGLSQVLTTLKIKTELVAKNFRSDSAEAERQLKEVLALADEAQTETKQVAYDLRPAILDDFGLKAAIAALASGFERGTGITTEFIAPVPDVRLESLLESSVYRIVQELLANVAKHAAATRISIQLLIRENILVLEVADNGKGFDASRGAAMVQTAPHSGLRNIRERVQFFGGLFRTESLDGRGTEVMIELPLGNMALPIHKQATGT
jgi:PAS domain S-box-containing protein